jgi:hypothetical protein
VDRLKKRLLLLLHFISFMASIKTCDCMQCKV